MLNFAGQTYPNPSTVALQGHRAASVIIQASDNPVGTAADLVMELLPIITSADTQHRDLIHLTALVAVTLQDGVMAADRRCDQAASIE